MDRKSSLSKTFFNRGKSAILDAQLLLHEEEILEHKRILEY